MKSLVISVLTVLLLNPAVWAAAAKLPKAEVQQMVKAGEKYLCDDADECVVHETVVTEKGYAMMMAEQEGAPDVMFVLFKKEAKVWNVLHAGLTSQMESVQEMDLLPEAVFWQLVTDFNEVMDE